MLELREELSDLFETIREPVKRIAIPMVRYVLPLSLGFGSGYALQNTVAEQFPYAVPAIFIPAIERGISSTFNFVKENSYELNQPQEERNSDIGLEFIAEAGFNGFKGATVGSGLYLIGYFIGVNCKVAEFVLNKT